MAADIQSILRSLVSFYDFSAKSVIHVGAGGGQLIDYAISARSVLAIDSDQDAVATLQQSIHRKQLSDRFKVIHADFGTVAAPADVVFFEFCLHEMLDPSAMLSHAQTLASDVLVIDHLPESPWVWHTCETEMAERSWSAVRQLHPHRTVSLAVDQRFQDYDELRSKVEVLGQQALDRATRFKGARDIVIELKFGIALLTRGSS